MTSSAGGGNTDVTGEASSIDGSARQVEASSVSERERVDSNARAAAAAPVKVPAGPPADASEGSQVERLIQLLEKSEATWAEGYNAERQRAEGIAKDLATVRAELTDRVTAEAAAQAEVARMVKLLEAKETEWTNKLDAERDDLLASPKIWLPSAPNLPIVLLLNFCKHGARTTSEAVRSQGNRMDEDA